MTHDQHGCKCPPFYPITLTLPVLLVLLGLFQGPLVKSGQKPRARPCSPRCLAPAGSCPVHGRWSLPRAGAEGGPAAWGQAARASVQAGLLLEGLGKPCGVPGFSADPRIASFCYFLYHILLEPQLRQKQCRLSNTLPPYLRPILGFVALLNHIQKLCLVIGPPLRSVTVGWREKLPSSS